MVQKWAAAGPPYVFGQVAHPIPKDKCFEVTDWGTPARHVSGMCLMDGVFLAARRSVCEAIQFDEKTFTGFHLYDLDFTLRASAAGFKLAVCNDLMLLHESKGCFDSEWRKYTRIFMQKHAGAVDVIQPEHKWAAAWCARKVRVSSKQALITHLRSPYWQD